MSLQGFVRGGALVILAMLSALAVAACGSSGSGNRVSGSASALVREAFSPRHAIRSGRLDLQVAVAQPGSLVADAPTSIAMIGRFQSRGPRRPTSSDLSISLTGQAPMSVISTGTATYLTAGGKAFRLPDSRVNRLQSGLGSTVTASSLSAIGIDPRQWLVNPRIVGSEQVGGVVTTHLRAGVDAGKFVGDLSTLLSHASSLGLTGTAGAPSHLSASQRRQIVAAIKDPEVDIWTGASDHLVRKLQLSLGVSAGALGLGAQTTPAAGTQTTAGADSLLKLTGTISFTDINRPQAITAPVNALPFSAFQARLQSLTRQLEQPPRAKPSAHPVRVAHSRPGALDLTLSPYARCISKAAGVVAKMQRCATLSNGTSAPAN